MNSKRRLRIPKSRTTTPKKQKFLSLRRQFPPCRDNKPGMSTPMRRQAPAESATKVESHQPEPQNLMDNQEPENVAYFFSAADGGATSLTGLLDSAAESNSSYVTTGSSRQDDLSPSASLTYANRIQDREERAALVRNALRSRERESSEEKWVCYSEVVERKVKEEEVSSSVVDLWRPGEDHAPLSLKLDYEDVVKAWSGRGSLYVSHAETWQIVPDVTDDTMFFSSHGGMGGCEVGWWAVPEMMMEDGGEEMKMGVGMGMAGQREASLLRYKAKRQNRLFSKKIRYQVRKLNAEKRPRIKGRFVKRG
ncbi:uncharacterized protein LOC127244576 [Andrographis paniculata]|uniref:uncharacterized protein LOC127244576 n=1 Tax=Andrographis paniculata TaxID=175694 RepID=UPI0021E94C62|nr:uncharacterized protein LOC127244576 [Andrographis paniculata]